MPVSGPVSAAIGQISAMGDQAMVDQLAITKANQEMATKLLGAAAAKAASNRLPTS